MKKSVWVLVLALVFLILCPLAVQAASNPASNVFDISEGNITLSTGIIGYRVKYGNGGSKNISFFDTITIIGKTDKYHISVESHVATTIKLSNVSIVVPSSERYNALSIASNAYITLKLEDNTSNRLEGGFSCSGIMVDYTSKSVFGTLVIEGSDSSYLTAEGNHYSSGISGGSITINGGVISAHGAQNAVSIFCDNLTINGGSVTADYIGGGRESIRSGNIIINGGNVSSRELGYGMSHYGDGPEIWKNSSIVINGGNIDTEAMHNYPKNNAGKQLYSATLTTLNANDRISKISGNYGIKDVKSNSKKYIRFYLPDISPEYYSLVYAGNTYTALVTSTGSAVFRVQSTNISLDSFTFAGTKERPTMNGVPYTGTFTVTQPRGSSTSNTIKVTSGEHNIALDGVNIDTSAKDRTCAFSVYPGATVNLSLIDRTTNYLISGNDCAGLEVSRLADSETQGTLVIKGGNGASLIAKGGNNGAGIGGAYIASSGYDGSNGGKITIQSGNITAKGGINAAGIGGGWNNGGYYGSSRDYGGSGVIVILGGTIDAQGGESASGIGCGYNASSGSVAISGGDVTARGGKKASGIGGGANASGRTVTITGGRVTAIGGAEGGAGIGGGIDGYSGTIDISGGTVTAKSDSNGAGIGGGLRGRTVKINITGGTVDAESVGSGKNAGGCKVNISGGVVSAKRISSGLEAMSGSVNISGGKVKANVVGANEAGTAAEAITITGGSIRADEIILTPVNEIGQQVYKATMITKNTNEALESVSPRYGLNGVRSDEEKKIYLYLPENGSSGYSTVKYAGVTYKTQVNGEGTAVFSKESPISIDTSKQVVENYTPTSAFKVIPTPSGIAGFTVEYKKHGAAAAGYATEFPFTPGIYDVRVTRPRDTEYARFELEIQNGLELANSFVYTVNYNGNGATGGATLSSEHVYNVEKELTKNGFIKGGFAFKGWDTDAAGTTAVYTDGQKVKNLVDKYAQSVTLYAVWTPFTNDVIYKPGLYGAGEEQVDVKLGSVPLTLKGAIYKREGFLQTGWATWDGGDKEYELGGTYTLDVSITLYPVWIKASAIIVDTSGHMTVCDSLSNAIAIVRSSETIRLTESCVYDGDLALPSGVKLDLCGFGLTCGKLTVPSSSVLIISQGQSVEISSSGESASPTRFAALKLAGEMRNSGNITLNNAMIQGIGEINMQRGTITLKGASGVSKIRLARGVTITLDESFVASGVSGIVYLPADCYLDGYRVLSEGPQVESYFTLGNAPDGNWFIGAHGCLLYGGMGADTDDATLIPEYLILGKDASIEAKNILSGSPATVDLKSSDESVLKVEKKNGKRMLKGIKEGEAELYLLFNGEVTKAIPVAVVAKEQAVGKLKGGESSIKLKPGEKKTLEFTIKPDTATDKTLFYYVDKQGVAKVENGAIIGVGKGNCRLIVVSTGGTRKVIKVTVKKYAKFETAELSAIELTLKKGEKATIEAIIKPDDADQSVSWSSKNAKIASVKGGVVTAKKPGETTIICKLSNGQKLGCKVIVTK